MSLRWASYTWVRRSPRTVSVCLDTRCCRSKSKGSIAGPYQAFPFYPSESEWQLRFERQILTWSRVKPSIYAYIMLHRDNQDIRHLFFMPEFKARTQPCQSRTIHRGGYAAGWILWGPISIPSELHLTITK